MDLVNSYKEGLSLDRINNDLPYSKSNCRWITMLEQQSNKRNNVLITYNNETKTLTQFAQEYGIRYDTLKWRLKHGWSIEKALNTKITQKEV